MPGAIQHIFVLTLENRSFDHMLGFSGIGGTDAVTGVPTRINGLISPEISVLQNARAARVNTAGGLVRAKGSNWPPAAPISIRHLITSNIFNGQDYSATQGADYVMPVDPGHEFCAAADTDCLPTPKSAVTGVLDQLCGPGAIYPPGGAYPPIANSGFVASYAAVSAQAGVKSDPGEIMKCYDTVNQLPVLHSLAREFVVCDNWFASIPGPTWPNRFFAHAASSGGLDHSPTSCQIAAWDTVDGFQFPHGTIFDRMNASNVPWRIYAGDDTPGVLGLHGIDVDDYADYHHFADDVAQPDYPASYTFIEPSYGHATSDFKCGTSQHPLDDVTRGEMLIKCTYEAIRNSPVWSSSLLIITWDEHGGFFDHVPPPNNAVAPGDTAPGSGDNKYGFTFQQYGVRVPAVVISPLIPRNLIDHRVYDHSSIPGTIEACFGLDPMTQRDAAAKANSLMRLVSLAAPRRDALAALPAPAESNVGGCDPFSCSASPALAPIPPSRPQDSLNEGNVPGILHGALRWDLALSPPEQRDAILARFRNLRTRADAWEYMNEVRTRVRAAKNPPL
jgi:phospholipase C